MSRIVVSILLLILCTSISCRIDTGWKGRVEGEFTKGVSEGRTEQGVLGSGILFKSEFGNQIIFTTNARIGGCGVVFDDGSLTSVDESSDLQFKLKYPVECTIDDTIDRKSIRINIHTGNAIVSKEGQFRLDITYTITSTAEQRTVSFVGVKKRSWY